MKALLVVFCLMVLAACAPSRDIRKPLPTGNATYIWYAIQHGAFTRAFELSDTACKEAGVKGVLELRIIIGGKVDQPNGRLEILCR